MQQGIPGRGNSRCKDTAVGNSEKAREHFFLDGK